MIEWVDPVPGKGRKPDRFKYTAEADAARANPGRWLLMPAGSLVPTTYIEAGNLGAFRPAGSFHATTRMVDGVRRTFVRYIGPTETAGDA